MDRMDKIVMTEITPLSKHDCFYIVSRLKDKFTYPIHRHDEFELNFVSGAPGARRVVGDSVETLGDYDLVLIGNGIEHGWLQHDCTHVPIEEVTIQFSAHLFDALLEKDSFAPIHRLLEDCRCGIAFSMVAIMRIYARLQQVVRTGDRFCRMLELMRILYELGDHPEEYRPLASSAFAGSKTSSESRRVHKVQQYVEKHFSEDITLDKLAGIVAMSPSSFSRFFKQRAGMSPMDYVIDVRLGHASQMLIDSTVSIAEIAYMCGFQNISNFNRLFKRKKDRTPKEFREIYKRHRSIV